MTSTRFIPRSGSVFRRRSIRPSEWTVANFKSIQHATLPLNPLTVLTGANSSGKSSLIQSLLLLAQSSDDEIVLNGSLVRLGEPPDVIRSGCNSLSFAYSVNVPLPDAKDPSEWSFEIELAAEDLTLVVTEFSMAIDGQHALTATSSRVTASVKAEVNPEDLAGDSLLRVREISGKKAPPRTYLSFRGLYPEQLILRRKRNEVLAALRRQFSENALKREPERVILLYDQLTPWWRGHQSELSEEAKQLYNRLIKRMTSLTGSSQAHDSEGLDQLFQIYSENVEAEEWFGVFVPRDYRPRYHDRLLKRPILGFNADISSVLAGLSIYSDGLQSFGDQIRYLGPLREEPQVVSPTGARNRSLPAGPRGEHTADLLVREKNSVVRFVDPQQREEHLKLPEAVSLWTTYLGVGDGVAVKDQGKLGRGLRLKLNGVERDLTMVGVGASQLLPVVAVVLAAEIGTTVCIEQPELHLHPAIQSRLADFFLWARPDISLVIETHSEYMITRLRRRGAEQSIVDGALALFFAEQDNGVTQLRHLRMNHLGDLSDWPKGFFDTQDEESRALVRAVATALEEKQTDDFA